MSFQRFLPYIAAVLLSAGCSRSTVDFEIDNPTDAPLTLSVDQQVHTLPPHTSMPLVLEPGQYRLQSGKIGSVRMVVYAGGIDSIPSARVADIEKATNHVRQGLRELLAGKPLTTPTSQA